MEPFDGALAEEFAGHGRRIHALKLKDTTFRTLTERNHAIWAEIERIQTGTGAASDPHLERLRRRRLEVLDEIACRLAATMV